MDKYSMQSEFVCICVCVCYSKAKQSTTGVGLTRGVGKTMKTKTLVAVVRNNTATGTNQKFNQAVEHSDGTLLQGLELEKLGHEQNIFDSVKALAIGSGLEPWTKQQETKAIKAIAKAPKFKRKDLRSLVTFTVDGDKTKDFDDAISARVESRGIRVWVHIADVAAVVRKDSWLDQAAKQRGTSVYLPGSVVPMLPKAISEGVCSLIEGQDRFAVTAEFLLSKTKVIEQKFYRSLIHSNARLTYGQVDKIFLGKAEPGPTYKAALKAARQVALDLSTEEIKHYADDFLFSKTEVVGKTSQAQTPSENMIEKLMVLANQQVAEFLAKANVPALHRNHQSESLEKTERVLKQLKALGIEAEPNHKSIKKAIENSDHPGAKLLAMRLTPPAEYGKSVEGHAGLGIDHYAHFTSPIRRYSDLVVHRALLAEIGAEEIDQTHSLLSLDEISEHLNNQNRQAKRLERQAMSLCTASLVAYQVRKTGESKWFGQVAGISERGVFVDFEIGEGVLAERDLGGSLDEAQVRWTDSGGQVLELGQRVEVELKKIDLVRGKIKLKRVQAKQ